MRSFLLLISVILWFLFTSLSAVYTKIYLNKTADSYTFTIITLFIGFVFNFCKTRFIEIKRYFLTFTIISVFNIASLFLTNISINANSVSFIYMIKAAEPLVVLCFSYVLLGIIVTPSLLMAVVQICIGVALTIVGGMETSTYGLTIIFFSILSTAFRSVMYKMTIEEHNWTLSPYSIYLNTSCVSFLLFLPCYLIKVLYMRVLDEDFSYLSLQFDLDVGRVLVAASVFNFLYNLMSIIILGKLATLTHSVINVTKRMFVVYSTMMFFATVITPIQIVGLVLADTGLLIYTYLKLRMETKSKRVEHLTRNRIKNIMCSLIIGVLFFSCLVELSRTGPKTTSSFEIQEEQTRITKKHLHKYTNTKNKPEFDDSMRILCLASIKSQIKSTFEPIIPKDKDIYVTYIPEHQNIGDTLIWMGEEKLLADLGVRIKMKIGDRHGKNIYNKKLTSMKNDAVILINGGGNFGDMWRWSTEQYIHLARELTEQKVIVFPQTVYYKNLNLTSSDAKVFGSHKDFTITVRSNQSEKLAKEHFTNNKIINSPDAAFYIGPIEPVAQPIYDFFILQRNDYEAKFKTNLWSAAAKKHFDYKYSYKNADWFDYDRSPANKSLHYIDDFALREAEAANRMMSQGRVIITDRLHASIYSLLIGRPHVIIHESYKKIYNTRENAFQGKPECAEEFIRAAYAKNVDDAYALAIQMLHRYY